ncbi:hypothetical protein [Microbacterium sp. GXF7504]
MTTTRRHVVSALVIVAALLVIGGLLGASLTEPDRTDLEPRLPTAWLSRILLVLAVLWVAIGAVSAHTSLVGKPGAAAARATWLAATTPWRARESTLGLLPLDRWLIFLVPVALLIATRMLQSSGSTPLHLTLVIGAWVVFALVLRLVVGPRSPWPVIAAVGGVVVIRCVFALVPLAVAGSDEFAREFWDVAALRIVWVGVGFMLFAWVFVAAAWALHAQGGARYAFGGMLSAIGAGIAVPALVIAVAGPAAVLERWDDGLGLVPHGLIGVLGDPAPAALAWAAVVVGTLLALVGVALAVAYRRSLRA